MSEGRLAFAFNDPLFSDRILVIQEEEEEKVEKETEDKQEKQLKRRKFDVTTEEKKGEERKEVGGVVTMTALHVSRLVLAAASGFFKLLFTTGMREAEEKKIIITVNEPAEGESVVVMIKWCYERKLPTGMTATDLLRLFLVADKFRVVDLLDICGEDLKRQMVESMELVALVLSLPAGGSDVQDLISAARTLIVDKFKKKLSGQVPEAFLSLPLSLVGCLLDRFSSFHFRFVLFFNSWRW